MREIKIGGGTSPLSSRPAVELTVQQLAQNSSKVRNAASCLMHRKTGGGTTLDSRQSFGMPTV